MYTETMTKPKQTALEVYRAGYRIKYNMMGGYAVLESKEFFVSLREAILYELEHYGYCTLIENLLETPKSKLDAVAYAVFLDIANGYAERKLVDVKGIYRDYIPYVTIRWSDCTTLEYQYYPLTQKVAEKIIAARNVARKGHHQYLRNLTESEPAGRPTLRPVPQPQKEEGERLLQQAKVQAEQRLSQAKLEAERINQGAHVAAQSVLDDAQAEAERIRQSAQNSAQNILDEANAKLQAQAKGKAERLVNQYIAQQQRQFKQECDAQAAASIRESLDTARLVETLHGEMCDQTNAVQANWIKALDSTLEQLNTVKADFYQHLRGWQEALYPRSVKPLAERYLELYRILNVDKLIREEVVFQDSASPMGVAPAPSTVTGLNKLNKTLTTFLRRFETALDSLGLRVYYPTDGELFDDIWHVPEEEDVDCHAQPIKTCVLPGIAKKAVDGGEDDVVIPAVVRI